MTRRHDDVHRPIYAGRTTHHPGYDQGLPGLLRRLTPEQRAGYFDGINDRCRAHGKLFCTPCTRAASGENDAPG